MAMPGTLESPEIWNNPFKVGLFRWLKLKLDIHGGKQWFFPGFMRMLSICYRFAKPKKMVLTSISGGEIRICLNGKDDVMTPEILAYGYHEEAATRLFKKNIKSGMTVIDIGANIGYYSLLAAKGAGPEGKIYSFEPDPHNYSVLRKNIEVNGFTNITAIPKALSRQKGFVDLYCDESNFGAHTLASENIQVRLWASIKVETLRLDDFLQERGISRVDFIKMDVQGAEGLVLEAAVKTLMSPGLKVLMEFWPAGLRNLKTDPLELLRRIALNFDVSIVENNSDLLSLDPEKILKIAENRCYVDLFCVRRNS